MPRKATTEKFAFVTAVALLSLLNAGVAQGSPSTSSYGERYLVKVTRCPGQVLSRSHRYRTLPARSALDCASRCRPDNRCLSFVFDSNVKECYLGDDVSRQDCSNMEPGHAGLKHYETVSFEGQPGVSQSRGFFSNKGGLTPSEETSLALTIGME